MIFCNAMDMHFNTRIAQYGYTVQECDATAV